MFNISIKLMSFFFQFSSINHLSADGYNLKKIQEDVLFSSSLEEIVCSHFPQKHEFDLP